MLDIISEKTRLPADLVNIIVEYYGLYYEVIAGGKHPDGDDPIKSTFFDREGNLYVRSSTRIGRFCYRTGRIYPITVPAEILLQDVVSMDADRIFTLSQSAVTRLRRYEIKDRRLRVLQDTGAAFKDAPYWDMDHPRPKPIEILESSMATNSTTIYTVSKSGLIITNREPGSAGVLFPLWLPVVSCVARLDAYYLYLSLRLKRPWRSRINIYTHRGELRSIIRLVDNSEELSSIDSHLDERIERTPKYRRRLVTVDSTNRMRFYDVTTLFSYRGSPFPRRGGKRSR